MKTIHPLRLEALLEAGQPVEIVDIRPRAEFEKVHIEGAHPAVIERLNTEVRQVLATPEIKQRLAALGADAAPMTPAEFDRLIARELAENAALAREAGINPQ